MIDVLFLTHNRLEFTKASWATLVKNTNWDLVHRLIVYDDCSTDGTREFMFKELMFGLRSEYFKVQFIEGRKFGGPASIMQHYISHDHGTMFAKIDSDVIVPGNWLLRCVDTMLRSPELDLLGIEPPMSRVPHFTGGKRNPQPEYEVASSALYAACDSIGGIGLMRTAPFLKYPNLVQHSTYGGFTEWQLWHKDIVKGWINPPLPIFLLDRMPCEPWLSLSHKYEREGNQRAWSKYPRDPVFWNWWKPEIKATNIGVGHSNAIVDFEIHV